MVALILLCIPTTLFWATYEQQGNTINLWAEQFTNRALIPGIVGLADPRHVVPVVQPVHDICLHAARRRFLGPPGERGKEPRTVIKMALGNVLLALSYLIMAAAAYRHGTERPGKLALALLAFFAVDHARRALSVADRSRAGRACFAAADPVRDDGPVVHHQFHRQPAAGLHRQLFQSHGQGLLLPALRRARISRRARHLGLRPAAALDTGSITG